MRSPGVYAFEAIEEDLPFLPLAARRVLDLLGRKMSLEAWLSLPAGHRHLLVRAGTEARVNESVRAVVDAAKPAPVDVPAMASTVSRVVRTRALATARRAVSAFSPTATMCTSPDGVRCVSAGPPGPTISSYADASLSGLPADLHSA